MDNNRFGSNARTPMQSTGRNSIYGGQSLGGRQSLFNMNGRNSMRPSDAGRFSYSTGVHASGMKKNMAHQINNAVNKSLTRNVRDKNYIEEQKRIIKEFLEAKESSIDVKYLNSSSATAGQFQTMFEFIYGHLDPDYHASASTIKDEFPAIMKSLKYPLQIKGSTMQSISSATAWPYILDALGYLVTFVNGVENVDVMGLISKNGADASRGYHSYDYFTKCFNKQKLQQDCNFDAELRNLREAVIQNEDIAEAEEIGKEKKVLQEELQELKKECLEEQCIELEEEETKYKKDVKLMKNYLEDAKPCYKDRLHENVQLQAIIDEKEMSFKKVKDEIVEKRKRISEQPISAQKAREARAQLNAVRERQKSIRGEEKNCQEGSLQLQGTIYKLLSSINERVAALAAKISETAEDFYSREEHSQHGFSHLGIDRVRDIDAIKERLMYFGEMYKKLQNKMLQDIDESRLMVQQNKDAFADCDRAIQKLNISTEKLLQDGTAKLKELQRHNDELSVERNRWDVQANVLVEKQKLADDKLKKVLKELEKLQVQIGNIEVQYGKHQSELDNEYDAISEAYTDKAELKIDEHIQIRKTQKNQDDQMEALLEQHTDLIERINAMNDGDDTTSK